MKQPETITEAITAPINAGASFAELRSANVSRCEATYHPVDEWSPMDWTAAMAGECGEAANVVKKMRRIRRDFSLADATPQEMDLRTMVGEELADLVIYADLLAARLRLNLGEEVRKKFNKVSERVGSKVFL